MDLAASVTDAVFAATLFAGSRMVLRRGLIAAPAMAIGLGSVGAAAAVGTARLAGLEELANAHALLTDLGGSFSYPLFAFAGTAALLRHHAAASLMPVVGIVLLLAGLGLEGVEAYRSAMAGTSMVGLAGAAVYTRAEAPAQRGALALGALGTLVIGLGMTGDWVFLGLSRVAWFHIVMTANTAVLLWGTASLPRY